MRSFEKSTVPYADQFAAVEGKLLPVIGNMEKNVSGDLRLSRELRVALAELLALVNRLAQSAALVEGEDWPDVDDLVVAPDLVP